MNHLTPVEVPFEIPVSATGMVAAYLEDGDIEISIDSYFLDSKGGPSRVCLKFERGFMRIMPAASDIAVVPRDQYDFKLVKEYRTPEPMVEYRKRHRKEWEQSGFSPNPRFYLVNDSEWISSLPQFTWQKHKHYLVVGGDCYAEIVTRNFTFDRLLK